MYVVTYDNGSGMREWACQPQKTRDQAISASGFSVVDNGGNADVRVEQLMYLWNCRCISNQPSLETVEIDGEKIEDYWVLINSSPLGEDLIIENQLIRHGVRKFMGLRSRKNYVIEIPHLYSKWLYEEWESDICLYCGQPNELQQADGSWVSLRMGFDCFQCGCN